MPPLPSPDNGSHGNAGDVLDRFERSIRQGDWTAVAGLTEALAAERCPATPEALTERLGRLRQVLIAARVARENLRISLKRVQAASRFAHSRRQDVATSADS